MAQLRHASNTTPAPTSSPTASASTSTATTRAPPIRRNMFHAHLSRRPTTSSTSTSAETLRLDGAGDGASAAGTTSTSATTAIEGGSDARDHESASTELVIRDVNGEFVLGEVGLEDEDLEDGLAFDASTARGYEDEKERQRISEAVKHHQRNRARAPMELLDAVHRSMRAKVAALADDNWMYEAEEPESIR